MTEKFDFEQALEALKADPELEPCAISVGDFL